MSIQIFESNLCLINDISVCIFSDLFDWRNYLADLGMPTREREGDRQTDRQAETDRQTGRQTDRQTDRQTERQREIAIPS